MGVKGRAGHGVRAVTNHEDNEAGISRLGNKVCEVRING